MPENLESCISKSKLYLKGLTGIIANLTGTWKYRRIQVRKNMIVTIRQETNTLIWRQFSASSPQQLFAATSSSQSTSWMINMILKLQVRRNYHRSCDFLIKLCLVRALQNISSERIKSTKTLQLATLLGVSHIAYKTENNNWVYRNRMIIRTDFPLLDLITPLAGVWSKMITTQTT